MFYGLEPWGAAADWFRAGTIAAAVHNANPFRKKGAPAVLPSDFVPSALRAPKPPAPTWQEQKARMLSWARSLGADVTVNPKEGAVHG